VGLVAQEKSYTPDEVAELLQISKYTVYEMVKRGDLSAYRIGRKLRFQKSDIEEYIKKAKGMDNVYKGVVVSRNGEKFFETGAVAISLITDVEGECRIMIEPDDIILAKDIVKSSARNVLRGQVENVEDCGPVFKIRLNVGIPLYAVITRQSYLDMEIALGDSLYAIFKSTSVRVL
jgi:molybdopterin-binding protein